MAPAGPLAAPALGAPAHRGDPGVQVGFHLRERAGRMVARGLDAEGEHDRLAGACGIAGDEREFIHARDSRRAGDPKTGLHTLSATVGGKRYKINRRRTTDIRNEAAKFASNIAEGMPEQIESLSQKKLEYFLTLEKRMGGMPQDAYEKLSERTRRELVRRYVTGNDVTDNKPPRHCIDALGQTAESLSREFPDAFQWLADHVRPEREQNPREKYAREWWLHAEPRAKFRKALVALRRFIVTTRTAKHRVFSFLDADFLPETTLVIIASDDAFHLGVLSSRIHVAWALATGGTLEDRPRYNKTLCFETFPFPTATEAQQTHIRDLAERLDTHRKRQQAQHPKLTFTDLYNVLEKLRAGTPLNAKEQLTHEQGLVTVLRQLHDDLDAAVAGAYALPPTASDEAILTHLCALNAQRAAEERTGTIRHLRPAFQNPGSTSTQTTLAGDGMDGTEGTKVLATAKAAGKLAWPKSFAEQALAVRAALTAFAAPADATTLAKTFKSAKADRISDLLETLASLGQARALPAGKYVTA